MMRSDLWRVRECPAKRKKKQEKKLHLVLQSRAITFQIRTRVMYLGASPVPASWSVKTNSSSSFSSSSATVSCSPWVTFEFLLLPSLPSSCKCRSNSQQLAHKISSLKIQPEIQCVSSHCHIPSTHILILRAKWGHFAAPHGFKGLLEGYDDLKGTVRVGFRLG